MKKVLRAIGGFFAKIGRWIANTAWVQPLLIVGGIFAIIFSIPYIKRAIENATAQQTVDTKLAYYQGHAVSLDKAEVGDGESKLDNLFNWLEDPTQIDIDSGLTYKELIIKNFGEKFFLTFAERDCENCKNLVDGYKEFEARFNEYKLNKDLETGDDLPGFKLFSVMADTIITDKNNKHFDEYPAKLVLNRHQAFLEEVAGVYAEEKDDQGYLYRLLNNIDDSKSMAESISKLSEIEENGIDVPLTLLIDFTDKAPESTCDIPGVTAIMFNYTALMKEGAGNKVNEAEFLRDCWTYSNSFSTSGDEINYYYEDAE